MGMRDDAYKTFAHALGRRVDSLSVEERQQAIVNHFIKAEPTMSELERQNAALKRGLQNIKDSFIGPRAKTGDLRQMIDALLARDQDDA